MIYSIYSKKDATIYEGTAASEDVDTEYMNTGIDEILEIQKIVSSSLTANTYNSRALVYFDIDWSKINAGSASTAASNSMYLNLYTAQSLVIPYSYNLVVHPISESWDMGLGRYGNKPRVTDGVSWTNRSGDGTSGTPWVTASGAGPLNSGFLTTGTGSNGQTNNGGGTWYTASFATQSFTHESTDIRMDVTNITLDWSSSEYPNEGFITKRSGSTATPATNQEGDTNKYGSLQFFAENTHTVYPPRLEICWNDKAWATGSLSALDMSDTGAVFFYLRNNRGNYKRGGKIRFYISGREKYPVKTYGTTSAELDITYTPNNLVCYSIKDVKTNETIIPYDDTYTNLSCHSTKGNYFDLYSDSLFEERDYKIQLRYKAAAASTDYSYYDIKDTFKVSI